MALYSDIAARGSACHLIGAGVVEYYYSQLSPKIFDAYVSMYKMTAYQAETYSLHGTLDAVHADRAFEVLDISISQYGWRTIEMAVRDAFVATSLHYDGMLQAALNRTCYWDGRTL